MKAIKINTPQEVWYMLGKEYVCPTCGGIFAFWSPRMDAIPDECPICDAQYDEQAGGSHESPIRS
jgi:rubrerythrin